LANTIQYGPIKSNTQYDWIIWGAPNLYIRVNPLETQGGFGKKESEKRVKSSQEGIG